MYLLAIRHLIHNLADVIKLRQNSQLLHDKVLFESEENIRCATSKGNVNV
jgi:hypothetical protein